MIGVKCSLQSILSHFAKVGKAFIPLYMKKRSTINPEQHYEEFGERRH